MKRALIALCFFLASIDANAQFVTGNKMVKWLDSYARYASATAVQLDDTSNDVGQLFGYVSAIADEGLSNGVCIPDGVTIGQMIAIIEKYIRSKPELWNVNASVLANIAMKSAFPCPTGK